MTGVRLALLISTAGGYGNVLVQLVGSMVLARLLTPHEIGVYSVGVVFMGFIHAFRDMGVGQYLVQERELTADKMRSVYGAVLLTSWSFAPLVYFAAESVALFYKEPGLQDVLHVLALSLVLIPFGATVQAYLARNMEFGSLLVIRLGSTITQTTTGVLLAWHGYGFMSLAWASVARVVAAVLLTNFFRPREMFLLPSFRGLGRVFRFGGKAVSMTLLNELNEGLPEIVLARTLGMAPLGFFNRARGQVKLFNLLFMRSLVDVGTPYFARLHRRNQPLDPAYQRAAENIVGVAWPLFGCLALLALPITRVLYGPQWVTSASLVPVLCLSAGIGLTFPLSGQVLIATGRINQALLQTALHTVLFAPVLMLGSSFGLMAVVWGGVLIAMLLSLWRYFTLRGLVFQRGWLPAMVFRNSVVMGMASAGPLLVRLWLGADPQAPVLALAVAGALASLGWLVGIAVTGHSLASEIAQLTRRFLPGVPVGWMLRRGAARG